MAETDTDTGTDTGQKQSRLSRFIQFLKGPSNSVSRSSTVTMLTNDTGSTSTHHAAVITEDGRTRKEDFHQFTSPDNQHRHHHHHHHHHRHRPYCSYSDFVDIDDVAQYEWEEQQAYREENRRNLLAEDPRMKDQEGEKEKEREREELGGGARQKEAESELRGEKASIVHDPQGDPCCPPPPGVLGSATTQSLIPRGGLPGAKEVLRIKSDSRYRTHSRKAAREMLKTEEESEREEVRFAQSILALLGSQGKQQQGPELTDK